MIRVLLFITFLVGLTLIMNLSDLKELKVENRSFNFQEKKSTYTSHKAKLAKLAAPPVAPKKGVEKKVDNKPLVELSTPQLKRGAALYKKCILCHGPRGQGKKSQNAPAIGGQYDWYIEESVLSMQKGIRINRVMMPYIRKLNSQDIKDLAAYISKLPPMGQ